MDNKKFLQDKAIIQSMYKQRGLEKLFKTKLEPQLKTQKDLAQLVEASFDPRANPNGQFDGVLQQNEFVDAFYNIYSQRILNTLKGEIPYINIFLKDAPFSGSIGYAAQDLKDGQVFSQEFTTDTFNPDERVAYLQVISTALRYTFADQISMRVIRRAATKDGGMDSYIAQRIGLLKEDYTRLIRAQILILFGAIKGKEIEINVPAEYATQPERRARYILQALEVELAYMADNSKLYTDTGFTSRTPKDELIALWSREALAEINVQALAMLRKEGGGEGIKVKENYKIPMDEIIANGDDEFYVKFMPKNKIHYSKSLEVSGVDYISMNLKGVYGNHYFVELDWVDVEPALTVKVNQLEGETTEPETPEETLKQDIKTTKPKKPGTQIINKKSENVEERLQLNHKARIKMYKKLEEITNKYIKTKPTTIDGKRVQRKLSILHPQKGMLVKEQEAEEKLAEIIDGYDL